MPQQLSFDLPAKIALGRDDYFVSPANALTVALIEAPDWPGGKMVLYGPAGAGKTHLTHVWAAQSGARIIAADDLTEDQVPNLAQGPIAVEDVPQIANDTAKQTALFHLHNLVLANGNTLLMTGQRAPHLWSMSLPDLQSRIQGAQQVALDHPDDALLAAVLAKLFDDRQIMPRTDVIAYLVRHMDRSLDAAIQIVRRLDQVSLDESRSLSRALATRLLTEIQSD